MTQNRRHPQPFPQRFVHIPTRPRIKNTKVNPQLMNMHHIFICIKFLNIEAAVLFYTVIVVGFERRCWRILLCRWRHNDINNNTVNDASFPRFFYILAGDPQHLFPFPRGPVITHPRTTLRMTVLWIKWTPVAKQLGRTFGIDQIDRQIRYTNINTLRKIACFTHFPQNDRTTVKTHTNMNM